MSYQALYRKYRPTTFSDVVGQEHITDTLKNELASGKIVHAYLFTGTRGTGKTSCAKILAKAVNCLSTENGDPCLECESCKMIAEDENTDIVEIDAASNNSVDSIRELREQVNFTPASSKYRVYIIDEVHMLTISAFNALLKTLEEPPKHVVFILATTEVHKLPATILSRCQRFDFRRIEPDKICKRIQYIASCEGITVTDEAATLIASAADGGMRDALSILDLCASGNKNIDEDTVSSVCAMAGNQYVSELAEYIKRCDCENALLAIDRLHNSSVDMQRLLSELISHYRNLMIIKTVKNEKPPIVCSAVQLKELSSQANDYDIKDIMQVLSVLQSATSAMQTGNRRCEMEMAIIKLCNPQAVTDISALEKRVRILEGKAVVTKQPSAPVVEETVIDEVDEKEESLVDTPKEAVDKPADKNTVTKLENWNEIMKLLRTSCPPIAGVLENSSAYIRGDFLLIDAPNSMFKTLINSENSSYKNAIRVAAQTVLGEVYKLGPYKKEKTVSAEDDPLAAFAENLKNFEI